MTEYDYVAIRDSDGRPIGVVMFESGRFKKPIAILYKEDLQDIQEAFAKLEVRNLG